MTVVHIPNESVPPAAGASEAAHLVLRRIDELDPAAIRAATAAG
jgi:hypothetical protein